MTKELQDTLPCGAAPMVHTHFEFDAFFFNQLSARSILFNGEATLRKIKKQQSWSRLMFFIPNITTTAQKKRMCPRTAEAEIHTIFGR